MSAARSSVGPGRVLDGRFEILEVAGTGGMGTVYRARDVPTGLAVAVKVLLGHADPERFSREARVLEGIRHPAVVRYVASGVTADGDRYIAMEWLTGEELVARLSRGRLGIGDTVALVSRVASALAEVHAGGAVHRDLKPSNLFLPGGRPDSVKILDFGIALPLREAGHMTRAGTSIGTPGYMAPEQARGDADVGPRADLFSLGCVAFECLTGQPAFKGEHAIALLAKVLLEDPPRIALIRPEVPAPLADLVERMMQKRPSERPADAREVLSLLAAVGEVGPEPVEAAISVRSGPASLSHITEDEQRLLSVILVGQEASSGDDTVLQPVTAAEASLGLSATVPAESIRPDVERLFEVARAHGAVLDHLAGGTWVLSLTATGEATDLAVLSARCALALRAVVRSAPVVLAMGPGQQGLRAPGGEVIERAARLLRQGAMREAELGIRVDELLAGLVGDRFEITTEGKSLWLLGEREVQGDGLRLFLGRATSCVGRDRELRALLDEIEASVAEPCARALLVIGEAGVGKSRVRHELLHRLATRRDPLEIWMARGDPLSAGAPSGLLGQALRRMAGVLDGEPLEERRRKLLLRVGRNLGAEGPRVAELLGELCGTPFPDEDNVKLRAARRDQVVMGDQVRAAWIDFLEAECSTQPVLIVLEDLHWGDLPTVQHLDAALRLLSDRPFVVLALGRPVIDSMYPGLWAKRSLVTVRLGALSRKACHSLAREVLGDVASAETVERLFAQSEGNAFFLEELLRAEVEGRGGDAPGTVLAMVQARLEALDPEARRVLRAASVFGQRFWGGGVSELLGDVPVDGALLSLSESELVSRARESRFKGEIEHAFRHAVVREAAYEMLTDEDRATGHRLAGAWLERAGEGTATVLAEHAERAGDRGRAAVWYHRAAEKAMEGNDLALAVSAAERALRCGESDPSLEQAWRGELHLLLARAHLWRGQNKEGLAAGLLALGELPRGSASFYRAVGETALASGRIHEMGSLTECAAILLAADLDVEPASMASSGAVPTRAVALAQTARIQLFLRGLTPEAEALLRRAEAIAAVFPGDDEIAGEIGQARFIRATLEGDPGRCVEIAREAKAAWLRMGDLRKACVQDSNIGYAYLQLGQYAAAEPVLRSVLKDAATLGLAALHVTAQQNLGLSAAELGRVAEAEVLLGEAIRLAREHGDRRIESFGRLYLGRLALSSGDAERALEESTVVLETPVSQGVHALARALSSAAHLVRGRLAEALEGADRAMETLEQIGEVEEGEADLRLAYIEAHARAGDMERACVAARTAQARVLEKAAKIADPGLRESFLTRVPGNARTLVVARELLGPRENG